MDMVATGFEDMWNPDLLCYDGELGRIFHRKWSGLSFAHEVEYENGEDPIGNFAPIVERMRSLGCSATRTYAETEPCFDSGSTARKRYTGRAARFDWACKNADHVLFVRTGVASRGEVCNLQCRPQSSPRTEKVCSIQAELGIMFLFLQSCHLSSTVCKARSRMQERYPGLKAVCLH